MMFPSLQQVFLMISPTNQSSLLMLPNTEPFSQLEKLSTIFPNTEVRERPTTSPNLLLLPLKFLQIMTFLLTMLSNKVTINMNMLTSPLPQVTLQ